MRNDRFIKYLVNAAVFIMLEVAALLMLRNNSDLQNIWVARVAHTLNGVVGGFFSEIGDYFSLSKTNEQLAAENFALRMQVTEHKLNSSLTAREQVTIGNFKYTYAHISKIGNNTQHNFLIIDKGSEDGVAVGSGVITEHGVVGVIDAVTGHFSYARSFKNTDMRVSTRIGHNGQIGPMVWDGYSSDKAVLKEIPVHIAIEKGDTVFTSGFSSLFPSDIPLGTIMGGKIVNGATYDIDIQLFEDFGSLKYVMIVENINMGEIKELEGMD